MSNVWIVSGQDNASNTNVGGGYDKDFYTGTFSELHDGDGGPIISLGGCTVSNNGSGYVRITKVSAFGDAQVGMYAECTFSADLTNGHYMITAIDDIDGDYIDIYLAYSSTSATATVYVGGFFALPSVPVNLTLVGAGDELQSMGGYTYNVSTTMDGSSSRWYAISSSGEYILPSRETNGTKPSGPLDTTGMPVINFGASSAFLQGVDYVQGISVTSNNSTYCYSYGNNSITYKCSFVNSGESTSTRGIYGNSYRSKVIDCDIIITGESSTNKVASIGQDSIVGCFVKSSSSNISVCLDVVQNGFVADCLVVGAGGGDGIEVTNDKTSISNCTIYNCANAIKTVSAYPVTVSGVLAVSCTNFLYNNYSAEVHAVSCNNCLVNVTNDYTGATYGYWGSIGDSDTSSTQSLSSVFEDAANDDFRLVSGADAIGAGMWGNDAGAIQSESTGGGDTVVISKGMLGVIG